MEAVGTVIILGYLSPPLAAALVTVVPASSFLVQWLSKRVVASSQQASAAVAASAATADELLENISTVRAFAAEPFEQVRARVCVCVWVSCLCRLGLLGLRLRLSCWGNSEGETLGACDGLTLPNPRASPNPGWVQASRTDGVAVCHATSIQTHSRARC